MSKNVRLNDGDVLDDLLIRYPKGRTFIFKPGNYYLNKVLKINKPNIIFKGLTNVAKDVHIYQNNTNMDGLDVEADGFTMNNISIHVPHPGKVALVFAGCNNTLIDRCYIYGNPTTFSVFYAGPDVSAGAPTLNTYSVGNLDIGNVMSRCVIYSEWSGDSVSYSLQKNGRFWGNIIRGGKLAVYMCKNCVVDQNTIYDSSTNGIFVSLPSHNVDIKFNIIKECQESGIIIKNQLEHGSFTPSNYNINIYNNMVYDSKFHAVDINDGHQISVTKNRFLSTELNGIYCLDCNNITVSDNMVAYFNTALCLENSSNSFFTNNICYSVYPDESKEVVKIINGSHQNTITTNIAKGRYISNVLYKVNPDSMTNSVTNNIYEPFYTYNEEIMFIWR